MTASVDDYRDIRLRDWRRVVGETGDLADIVLATLSLASTENNTSRIHLREFYKIFTQLQKEFSEIIPKFHTRQLDDRVFSRALGDALENALRLGVDIANPRFQYLGVAKPAGRRNLERLQLRAGSEFVDRLRPVARRLAQLVEEAGDS